MDGVESVLTDSSLVQVSAVTDLLLLLNDLCAVGHYCGGRGERCQRSCTNIESITSSQTAIGTVHARNKL